MTNCIAACRRHASRIRVVLVVGLLGLGGIGSSGGRAAEDRPQWQEIAPRLWATSAAPRAYAIVAAPAGGASKGGCLLIGASRHATPEHLPPGAGRAELVLLTHSHRDSCASAQAFVDAGATVRANRDAVLLSPDGVADYWKVCLPVETPGRFPPLQERFWNNWSYLVAPTGVAGVRRDLADGDRIEWHGHRLEIVATPGHTRDHLAVLVERMTENRGASGGDATGRDATRAVERWCLCGDAWQAPGKIWSPYTLEWHHQRDEGAVAAAASLRKLIDRRPTLLGPEHGEPLRDSADAIARALTDTAERLERVALLKNYDRYTKELVGSPPTYRFLAPDQVGTADGTGNPRPWTRLSPHLLLTGNTFALVSRDGPVLLVDPYGPNMAARVEQLRTEHGSGPLEVAVISHGHNDHYTGIFNMPRRDAFQVWTLDRVADAVDHPEKYRAPYVDARRPRVDRTPRDGETVKWREYDLKFHHFPGQTEFTNAIETTIDGRRCWFTADNFFHVDQYSGSGGWSALNRALPGGYARSARKILDAAPEWILAEHGGPFEFSAEDFRRREAWAVDSGRAADRLSPSGDHRHDWDLHRVRLEPLIAATTAGATREVAWIVSNPLAVDVELDLRIESPSLAAPVQSQMTVPAGGAASRSVRLSVAAGLKVGRHPVPAVVTRVRTRTTRDAADAADSADAGKGAGKNRTEDDPADVFVVLDVR